MINPEKYIRAGMGLGILDVIRSKSQSKGLKWPPYGISNTINDDDFPLSDSEAVKLLKTRFSYLIDNACFEASISSAYHIFEMMRDQIEELFVIQCNQTYCGNLEKLKNYSLSHSVFVTRVFDIYYCGSPANYLDIDNYSHLKLYSSGSFDGIIEDLIYDEGGKWPDLKVIDNTHKNDLGTHRTLAPFNDNNVLNIPLLTLGSDGYIYTYKIVNPA